MAMPGCDANLCTGPPMHRNTNDDPALGSGSFQTAGPVWSRKAFVFKLRIKLVVLWKITPLPGQSLRVFRCKVPNFAWHNATDSKRPCASHGFALQGVPGKLGQRHRAWPQEFHTGLSFERRYTGAGGR